MQTIIGILAFIFALGLIILVHEGGHFLFARRVNVLCREFAFGMGPRLLKKKKGETTYSLRAFPIGGFCAIAGEEVEDDPLTKLSEVKMEIIDGVVKKFYIDSKNAHFDDIPSYKLLNHDIYDEHDTGYLYVEVEENGENVTYTVDPKAVFVLRNDDFQIAPHNRTLGAQRKRDRAMIMFGGPMMNFVLALVVFLIAGLILGYPNEESSIVDSLDSSSPAYMAGLRDGDEITSLSFDTTNKYEIKDWHGIEEFMDLYSESNGNNVQLSFVREDVTYNINVKPLLILYSIGGMYFYQDASGNVIVGYPYENEEDLSKATKNFEGTSLYEAGMRLGQVVNKVNGTSVTCLQDLYKAFMDDTDGSKVTLTVDSEDIEITPYTAKVMKTQKSLSGESIPLAKIMLGVSPTYKFGFFKSFAYAGKRTIQSTTMIIDTLRLLFTGGIGLKNLGGFISIYSYTSSAASLGFGSLLNWIGLLSVNIGIMNLLPIPALDGGRLVFVAYEAITKKKPNPKVETILITVTMILLFALMIVVTFNDIMRLF